MLKEYSFDNIYIRHAIDEDPDDREFTMHIHEQCEIYFLVSGEVEYLVEGSEYPLDESSLMIMRPAEAHKPRITGRSRYERFAINFPIDFADNIDPDRSLTKAFTNRPLGKNNMFSSSETDMKLVHKLLTEMCVDDKDYDKQLTVKTHLLIILDMIKRASDGRKNIEHKPRSISERIVLYVNNHLYEDISVPLLAKHFYLSTSQFSRLFRRATGAAPWEYITKKRLTAAKERINGGQSVRCVSESCGFKDYSSFYRAYVKYFGCAPKGSK